MNIGILNEISLPRNGRPIKFTPTRIEQIRNLVERGKTREEIAEIIGCTVGSLQVTCSKLGVSLRRPRFDTFGMARLPTRRKLVAVSDDPEVPEPPKPAAPEQPAQKSSRLPLTIVMEYRGVRRITDLPLDEAAVATLALEAEMRGLRLGELVAQLLMRIVEVGDFDLVRDAK